MGLRKAVLSTPRTLDMVPLGDDLQGGSNQGVKALSDHVLSSVRRWGAATTSLQIFVDEYRGVPIIRNYSLNLFGAMHSELILDSL